MEFIACIYKYCALQYKSGFIETLFDKEDYQNYIKRNCNLPDTEAIPQYVIYYSTE